MLVLILKHNTFIALIHVALPASIILEPLLHKCRNSSAGILPAKQLVDRNELCGLEVRATLPKRPALDEEESKESLEKFFAGKTTF